MSTRVTPLTNLKMPTAKRLRPTKAAVTEPSPVKISRMFQIHQMLAAGRPVNCFQLGRELEVDRRTIHRSMDFMRDQLQLPISYDAKKRSYVYTRPVDHFPTLTLGTGEMAALITAQSTLAQYAGAPLSGSLTGALNKISQLTGGTPPGSLPTIKVVGAAKVKPELFERLAAAIQQRQPVQFDYRRLGEAETGQETRRVHPHHVACTKGRWYLAAYDRQRQAMRTFCLSRMEKFAVIKGSFERQADFDPEKYFPGGFGFLQGQGDYLIEIEFDRWGADLLQTNIWHPSQKVTPLPDGGARLHLRLNSLAEITNWLMSWGEHATVIGPEELRQRLLQIARVMMDRYSRRGE